MFLEKAWLRMQSLLELASGQLLKNYFKAKQKANGWLSAFFVKSFVGVWRNAEECHCCVPQNAYNLS